MYAFLTLFSTVLLLAACSVGGTITISTPSSHGADAYLFDKDGIIQLEDLSLSIKPDNFKGGVVTIGPIVPIIPIGMGVDAVASEGMFDVAIQFETDEEFYELDASRIELIIHGKSYNPLSIAGPTTTTYGSREHNRAIPGHDWLCYKYREEFKDIEEVAIPPSRSCVFVRFGVETPDPEQQFNILIKGLYKDGRPVEMPRIYFNKGFRPVYFLLG